MDKTETEFMEFTKFNTLVKYDPPVALHKSNGLSKLSTKPTSLHGSKSEKEARAALKLIFPPRIVQKPNRIFRLNISFMSTTKAGVIALGEKFEKLLHKYKAKQAGICHIRFELYSQLFDEILRQTTIDCASQGLLLARIRNEIRDTISSFQKLYQSSAAFYIRNSLLKETELLSLKQGEGNALSKLPELQSTVVELRDQLREKERKYSRRMRKIKAKHTAEILNIRREMEGRKKLIWNKLFPKEEYVPDKRWL